MRILIARTGRCTESTQMMYSGRSTRRVLLIPLVGSNNFRIHSGEVVIDIVLLLVGVAL
jgi:hypothetical protein